MVADKIVAEGCTNGDIFKCISGITTPKRDFGSRTLRRHALHTFESCYSGRPNPLLLRFSIVDRHFCTVVVIRQIVACISERSATALLHVALQIIKLHIDNFRGVCRVNGG